MGAARRLCVRAVVLAGMMSAIVSLALPACQFPSYGTAHGGGGSGGDSAGGLPADAGGGDEGGEAGEAGAGGDAGDGGSADGGKGAGGAGGAPAICPAQSCVPRAPKGWQPVAFWERMAGAAGAPPGCPAGYTDPEDLHHDLVGGDGCSCTCSAQGQVCQGTLHIYNDLACASQCATASPLSSPPSCDAVSNCPGAQGSVRVDPATISGGSCVPTVSPPGPASWQWDTRLCPISEAAVCEDPSQVCAPMPGFPFVSQSCVMSVVSADHTPPECPEGYASASPPLYESFTDKRECSGCTCSGVSGGSCTTKLTLTSGSDCKNPPWEFTTDLPSCKTFNLGSGGVVPTHVGGLYSVNRGTCGVTSPSHTLGTIAPSGQITVVCCQ